MAQLDKDNWIEKRKTTYKNESAKMEFEALASEFNEGLQNIQSEHHCGVNFHWKYRDDGTKYIEVADVGPLGKPTEAAVARAKVEVPDIMKKAEGLIAKPMETRPNVDGPVASFSGSQTP